MDIVDLDEMGLIDSSTEFITGLGDSSIIYAPDGSITITSDDFAAYGNRVAYVTLPNLVQIVQDESSQNVGYLINNTQVASVNQAVLVNQDGYVEVEEEEEEEAIPNPKEGSEDSLQKQLSDYLTTPTALEPTTTDRAPSRVSLFNTSNCDKIIDDNQDVDPPDKTGSMFCDKCSQQFSSWKLYKKHKWKHLHEKPFQCSFCPESFNYELNLNLHLATHNIEKPYCPVCKKHFNRVASLKAHIMLHEQEESLFCNECGEEFASHIYLQRHMVEHRAEKNNQKPILVDKAYKCRQCNQSFDSASNYKLHRVKFHKVLQNRKMKKLKRRSGNNTCEYCQKSFEKPSQLLRHKRIHTGERPYKCDLCPRAFNQKGSVQIHMLKHTKERPYVCQYCRGTFSQKGNLQAHVKRLHMEPEGDEKVYKCELCTCIFRKLGSLNAHFTKAHNETSLFKQVVPDAHGQKVDFSDSSNKENENSKKDDDKPEESSNLPDEIVEDNTLNERKGRNVVCSYCSKVFKRPGDLVRHIRTHTLEKPFKCKICNRGFSLQSTLSIHLKTHNDGKKFICPICKKCYSNAHNLKLHRKKHIVGKEVSCVEECFKDKEEQSVYVPEKSEVGSSTLVCLDRVDMSALEPNNIILTESGNIVDMSSDIEEETVEKLYKCLECNMIFRKKAHLNIHLRVHNSQSYNCEHCPCTFNSRNTLNSHIKQQHSSENPSSTDSDKQVTSHSGVKHHQGVNVNSLPWGCSVCGWSFKSQHSAKKHILSVHPKERETAKLLRVLGKIEAEKPKKDFSQEESNTLPIVVMNQTDDLQANFKDLISLQQNQVFILANEDGGFTVPHKTVIEAGEPEAYTTYQEDLVMNTSESTTLEKQVFENGLDTCIFTLQPALEANSSIIDASNLSSIVSQPQQISRCDMANLLLTNLAEFSDDKTTRLLEKPHTCISCEKSFSSAIEYEEHMKLHKVSSKMESKKTIDSYSETETHIQNVFTCGTCNLNFISFDDLTSHQEVHVSSEGNKYACDVCSAQFTTPQEVQEHCKEHIIEEIIKCSVCLMEFSTEEKFSNHCQKFHAAQMPRAEKKKVRLNWRPPAIRLTEEEAKALSRIEPDNASEKVLLQSLLEKERFEHPVKEEPKPPEVHRHKCKYCPKSFRKPSDLIRHMRTHTGEKPYKCTSCNKRFSIKSAAASHLKTHTKDKSFECYVCSKMFSTTGSLKIHMRLHTGLKPFACNICDARFRTSGHKKAHLLKHLRVNLEKSDKEDSRTDESYDKCDELGLRMSSDVESEIALSSDRLPSVQSLPPDHGSQYLVPLQTDPDNICALTTENNDEFLMSFKISDTNIIKEGSSKTSKFLLNINDEGGGTGGTPRYFLSIKDGGTGEDGFVLESISDDQIVVTITKGDSDIPSPVRSTLEGIGTTEVLSSAKFLTCLHCQKTFSKQITLDKHIKKFHPQELYQCNVCFENFEQQSDLDVHCLAHELDREYTCAECGESFPLEEEFRAHKCVKAASLDLSLEEHDLFLFT